MRTDTQVSTLPAAPSSRSDDPPISARAQADSFESIPASVRITQSIAWSASHELRGDEKARARTFAGTMALVSLLVVFVEPFVQGAWWLRAITMATMVLAGGVLARIAIAARDPRYFTRRIGRTLAATVLVLGVALTYRFGVLSPAVVLSLLGVAFFGVSEDRILAFVFAFVAAGAYALVAWLVASRALPDAGLLPLLGVPPATRAALVGLVVLASPAVLVHARRARGSTLAAIERSNEWFRQARQREAQRGEANRDLDMLLKMSASEIAPYTGLRAGKYALDVRIGRGAMGEVYAAKHSETGQAAAVKLLNPSLQEDALYMQRLMREGEAAAKLRGPNVVSIFEVGKLDDGAPFIAMELLRGHDLGWHLRMRVQLPLDEVVLLALHVGAGLETARIAGVVHRDLKPSNLFLAQQTDAAPIWKILDFGVSRLTDSSGTLTKDLIVGTPGYMSPEQAGGLAATHRSDVFSLGAVVYRALTGQAPFIAGDTPQTLYHVVYRNPVRPSEHVPSLPPDVDLVLAIALAKDPADRFVSALAMATALDAAARSALHPELRLHGRTLLAALPWGSGARDSDVAAEEM